MTFRKKYLNLLGKINSNLTLKANYDKISTFHFTYCTHDE